jgi:two-component system nitrogen regulation response regulator NtrX
MALLTRYNWPGNVRELKNLVERLAIMVNEPAIKSQHLPRPYNPEVGANDDQSTETLFGIDQLKTAKQLFEKQFIQRKLNENDHNVSQTARVIGVERSYLHRRIKKLDTDH